MPSKRSLRAKRSSLTEDRFSGRLLRFARNDGRVVVFIDRDGVLNSDPGKAYYVRTPGQFKWIPGVLSALGQLSRRGARLVVISNQAGVGKGLVKQEALNAITQKIFSDLTKAGAVVEGVFYCTHTPEDGCACRKPADGLFRAADRALKLAGAPRFMIGDTERDMTAGRSAGCRTVLVLSGKTRKASDALLFKEKPDHVATNLKEAIQWVLSQKKS